MSVTWTIEHDPEAWTAWAQRFEDAPPSPFMQSALAGHRGAHGTWALDVGCGTGRAFGVPNQHGYRVLGIDVTLAAAQASQRRVRSARIRGQAVCATAACLPAANRSISLAIAIGVLFHLGPTELPRALAELRRVLARSGLAMLHFLDERDWRRALAPEVRPEAIPRPSYQAVVTSFRPEQDVRELVASAGMAVETMDLHVRSDEQGQRRESLVVCR
jgi:ubiquinone/menaquinone biosynthesis C-methylase UbiE